MKQTVDARGLACPQPVVLTLKAIANAAEVTTIVDNQAAVENVTRLARSKGCTVEVEEKKDGIYLTIKGQGAPAEPTIRNQPALCPSFRHAGAESRRFRARARARRARAL